MIKLIVRTYNGAPMPQALSGLVLGLAWTDVGAGIWLAVLAVYWWVLYWMYQRKLFIRV